ncbi:apolipoprotein R-like [Pteronotus mesoamericanus]|uniref:apolipoprotein R-like n=1 Tax=Pteronotus mesoamericanus TaxID=1884717 RepID=UPI0023EDDFE5|nr:apolipoprotein R-like [Pteronotus parnellii mesoamericanus]
MLSLCVAPLRLSSMPHKLQSVLPPLCLLGFLTSLLCPSGLCDCSNPPSIAHGSHHDVSSYFSFTTAVHYECDEGYILVGNPKITCRKSQWSSPAPECKALCLKPEIENGNLSVDKTLYVELENVTIQCDNGYGLVSNQSITCSENRTWHPEVPTCEWEVRNGCEQVVEGSKLLQCLPRPEEVKMALEVYKLSLEIRRLKQE